MTAMPLASFLLLWLTGFSVRVTLLAVPPLLPILDEDFSLTRAEVAALTTLPVLLFSAAAVLGSRIISSVGARRTLVAGLLLAGVAAALRGTSPSTTVLFFFTFLMGLGIAAVQPAVPTLIQSWVPGSIALATAAYLNGIFVSQTLAASLTLPVVLPAVGSWQATFAVWAIPVIATSVLAVTVSREKPGHEGAARPRWLPSWGESRTWRLGFLQASASVGYFTANAMLPVYLEGIGRGGSVAWALTSLNATQLAASVMAALLPLHISAGRFALSVTGLAVVTGGVGVVIAPALVVLWAGVIGFCAAFLLIVALALPAALESGTEVARLTAGMFTIGYALAFLLPLAGGALWDATGSVWTAFAPVLLSGAAATVVGGSGVVGRHLRGSQRLLEAATSDPGDD